MNVPFCTNNSRSHSHQSRSSSRLSQTDQPTQQEKRGSSSNHPERQELLIENVTASQNTVATVLNSSRSVQNTFSDRSIHSCRFLRVPDSRARSSSTYHTTDERMRVADSRATHSDLLWSRVWLSCETTTNTHNIIQATSHPSQQSVSCTSHRR